MVAIMTTLLTTRSLSEVVEKLGRIHSLRVGSVTFWSMRTVNCLAMLPKSIWYRLPPPAEMSSFFLPSCSTKNL
jgi:hypothetical protein